MRQRGSGTIRKLKAGYQARYMDESGRQVPAPITFKTKADANLWLADRICAQARGTWHDPRLGGVLLREFGTTWVEHRDYTPRSRQEAERLFRSYVDPELGYVPLNKITPAAVRQWHASLRQRTGAPTVRLAYNLLKAILNTAVADDLIVKNPCQTKGASKAVSPKRPYLTFDESMQVIEKLPEYLRALAVTAWWSSTRVGEVLALRWSDVNLTTGHVHIHRQIVQIGSELLETPPKAHSDRFINISGPGLDVLRMHKASVGMVLPSARVFTNRAGGALTPHAVGQAWRRARTKAGLPNAHFHDLRASSATALLQSGATVYEVMAVLGHSSMKTTQGYQHNDPTRAPVIAAGLAAHILRMSATGSEGTANG